MTVKSQNKQRCIVAASDSRLAAASELRRVIDEEDQRRGVWLLCVMLQCLQQKNICYSHGIRSVLKYTSKIFDIGWKNEKNKEINHTRNRTFGSPHIVLSASNSIGYVVHLSHAALLGCCSSWLATRAQRVPHHFVAVALLYFCYHRGQMLHENLQLQYHSTCPNHIHHGRYIQYVT